MAGVGFVPLQLQPGRAGGDYGPAPPRVRPFLPPPPAEVTRGLAVMGGSHSQGRGPEPAWETPPTVVDAAA